MFIMYVDESGVESVYDKTEYFVTAGVIVHEDYLETFKTEIRDYVNQNFRDAYADAEIHVHDMYKGKKLFFGLNQSQKLALLTSLYTKIDGLQFTAIAIGINKKKFAQRHSNLHEILDYGHMLLVERFDNFIEENDSKGIIRIDRTTPLNKVNLNPKDTTILKLINRIRKRGTRYQTPAVSIVEEPLFLPSHVRIGLQVADAVVYCTNRYINNNHDFNSFWSIIYSKFRRSDSGKVEGYGFRIYPR